MPEIIFHQYAMSPFSEKIRKILALKNLEYREVDQPAWMPKPHLTPMTGGYRRIPVLQIGADIYCDTALIARTVEKHCPEPSIHPGDNIAAAEAMAVARASEPVDVGDAIADDPSGLELGIRVGICSDDLPTDVFVGKLVALRDHEMVIERQDAAVGRVAVHFPRACYQVRPV